MFKTNRQVKAQLDRIGTLVLRAAADNDAAVAAATESPFLYTKIRAAMAGKQSPESDTSGWMSLFLIARRAVPAMALVTLLTVVPALMFLNSGTPTATARFDEDTFFDTRGNSLPGTILTNRDALSGDEVFSIVVERSDRGSSK